MTQRKYLKKKANAIIDYDTEKELNYCQLCKHTKHQKIWKQSLSTILED